MKAGGLVKSTPVRLLLGVIAPAIKAGGRVNNTPSMMLVGLSAPVTNPGSRANRTPLSVCAPTTGVNNAGLSLRSCVGLGGRL